MSITCRCCWLAPIMFDALAEFTGMSTPTSRETQLLLTVTLVRHRARSCATGAATSRTRSLYVSVYILTCDFSFSLFPSIEHIYPLKLALLLLYRVPLSLRTSFSLADLARIINLTLYSPFSTDSLHLLLYSSVLLVCDVQTSRPMTN